jgi:hypothetical protein
MTTKTETVQVERATFASWGGRAVHLTVERNRDGEPEHLELCEGWTEGGRDLHRAVRMPGHLLADLHAALAALLEADTSEPEPENES